VPRNDSKPAAHSQPPRADWIGCSDSPPVPAHEIVARDPAGSSCAQTSPTSLPRRTPTTSPVAHVAVDVQRVKHIIVIGQYGGGGMRAAVEGKRRGLVHPLGHPIREVCHEHHHQLDAIPDPRARLDRPCERNVIRPVKNRTSDVFVPEAWARGQDLSVHGRVYPSTTAW